ncbi:MAG: UPF0365 family protein [Planctomycetaceae bacterium]|nr:UPF0365 family protein [Planctomycetaceae bacterium]
MPSIPSVLAQGQSNSDVVIYLVVGAVLFLGGILFLAVFARYFSLWIQCKMTGAGIGLVDLVLMSFRKVNTALIVRGKIMAVQSGLTEKDPISTRNLEAHFLAGGNIPNVIKSLIAAHRAKINLDWRTASAIDLAGRNILDAVQTSVYPKVIDCPDSKKNPEGTLSAVCGDGIELRARARVTVRTNLEQLIGGATEETIVARVGQGIVQAIGKQSSYKIVLESPELISQEVLHLGLEKQTAFEIVSIDIADIDVGDNIGARLQADQAEADMRVAQAKAEQKRAEMAAKEQEMFARVQENRAKVVLAEAHVPQAIAASLVSGRLGLMDYYELHNVQADTRMRASIAGDGTAIGNRN